MARFAFSEEWLSQRAKHILPYLVGEHEIHYISSGTEVPPADFASVTLFKFPRYQQQNSLHISGAVRRLYRRGAIDFVVDYSYMGWALRRIPIIEIVGGLYRNDFVEKWQEASWLKRPRLGAAYAHYCLPEKICIRRARRIVTDNQVNADIIRSSFGKPADSIAVIPNGVDAAFSDLYAGKDFSRPALLFAGNLHPRKGIAAVLRSFTQSPEISLQFIVCGDGPDRDEVEALADRDPRISYRGRVSRADLLEIEAATTIFVFPSLTEGCPNALLEAMASGHACITYDVPTVQALIKGLGVVCEPNRPGAVVAAIKRLLAEPRTIAELAKETQQVSAGFSWAETAARFGDIFRETGEQLLHLRE